MPTEIQVEIFSRVAKISRAGVRNLIAAIPPLATSAAVPLVYKNLNLHPLTIHPLASLTRYNDLMDRCLASGNLHAHYIRGIQEYFHNNNVDEGLPHLRTAAEGLYDNAIYLYGIIMLCRGETAVGQSMLDSLGWRENKKHADTCWKRIKRSIHGIKVIRLPSYTTAFMTTRATITCHPDNISDRCDTCYYYKQITKFVFII
ncbi:hypothetical protein N665_0309s0044 [Sinapis alba]|nr:hypothetical protein N665_0309s0044 [Sinapis alba]